jgi:microcystin-dependent protein
MIALSGIISLASLLTNPALSDDKEVYRAIAMEVAARIQLQIPIGVILPFASHGIIPDGYIECNGQELPKGASSSNRGPDYSLLYAVIGDEFTPAVERSGHSFRVPDLTGSTLLGAGKSHAQGIHSSPSLTEHKLGERSGAETHTLTIDELPSHKHNATDTGHNHAITQQPHTHSYQGASAQHGSPGLNGGGIYVNGLPGMGTGGADANIQVVTSHAQIHVEPTGNGHAFSTLPPSVAVRYIMRWKGSTHSAVDENEVRHSEDTHLEESHEIRNPASQSEREIEKAKNKK